jgi:hypothetical protein
MDMKKILQAMDGAASKPVEGVDSMAKFIRVVNESKSPLNRLTTAESMAMNHYTPEVARTTITNPVLNVAKDAKPSMIGKYFKTVETEFAEGAVRHKDRARQLAERVIERVTGGEQPAPGINRLTGKPIEPQVADPVAPAGPRGTNLKMVVLQQMKAGTYKGFAPKLSPEEIEAAIAYKQQAGDLQEAPIAMDPTDPNNPEIYGHEKANPMTLKGRIMSARAQLKELAELADSDDLVAWERITQLHKGGMFMGLAQNLEQIRHGIEELAAKRKKGGVASRGIDKGIGEDKDPCWDSHKMVGTKKKGGKTVPNCVPK